eukprot:CAMPEP_0185268818 /NCGR_PEP_ID=MMETSP1359-20130426/38112_1 /TAXON_ID=552665 /ORGANISM="Bigelowiella longifila, Strain CCMP242" /LENGTH=129 /DNA_ID=CAMNT_0027859725 /DNA_START=187 /DNA_END=578 /DNA_ORIENTATION=-
MQGGEDANATRALTAPILAFALATPTESWRGGGSVGNHNSPLSAEATPTSSGWGLGREVIAHARYAFYVLKDLVVHCVEDAFREVFARACRHAGHEVVRDECADCHAAPSLYAEVAREEDHGELSNLFD